MKFLENFDVYSNPPETRINVFKTFNRDSSMGDLDDFIKKSTTEIDRMNSEEDVADDIEDLVTAAELDNDLEVKVPIDIPEEEDNALVINRPNGAVKRTRPFPYGMSGKGDEVLP